MWFAGRASARWWPAVPARCGLSAEPSAVDGEGGAVDVGGGVGGEEDGGAGEVVGVAPSLSGVGVGGAVDEDLHDVATGFEGFEGGGCLGEGDDLTDQPLGG